MIEAIIDTDPGIDDALALMLAVKSRHLNVRTVTTVAGNTCVENTTANARFVLSFLDREDIPVYSGAAKPQKRNLVTAAVHGDGGLSGLRKTGPVQLTGDAASRLVNIVSELPGQITILVLGPSKNVAEAIRLDATVMLQVRELVIMGGIVDRSWEYAPWCGIQCLYRSRGCCNRLWISCAESPRAS